MSLVITIRVNDDPPLETITARRCTGGDRPDDVNIYEIERYDMRGGSAELDVRTHLQHRYDDGAHVLACKALEATT
jgi:hypothetical protein